MTGVMQVKSISKINNMSTSFGYPSPYGFVPVSGITAGDAALKMNTYRIAAGALQFNANDLVSFSPALVNDGNSFHAAGGTLIPTKQNEANTTTLAVAYPIVGSFLSATYTNLKGEVVRSTSLSTADIMPGTYAQCHINDDVNAVYRVKYRIADATNPNGSIFTDNMIGRLVGLTIATNNLVAGTSDMCVACTLTAAQYFAATTQPVNYANTSLLQISSACAMIIGYPALSNKVPETYANKVPGVDMPFMDVYVRLQNTYGKSLMGINTKLIA